MPPGGRNQAKAAEFQAVPPRFRHFRRVERPGPPLYGPGPDHSFGASPSGKALDFDSSIRRFDPFRPSHPVPAQQGVRKEQDFSPHFRMVSPSMIPQEP